MSVYVLYLRDTKRGRNPSRKQGRFWVHVSLKLFFLENIFRQSVSVLFFQSSGQASLRLSNVFMFTFPAWNFTDYISTFAAVYDICCRVRYLFLKIGLCLVLNVL